MTRHTDSVGRRTVLETIGAGVVGTTALSSPVAAGCDRVLPADRTQQTDPQPLGNGAVSTFTTTTPAGDPEYVGVRLSAGALDGLATPQEVADSDRGVEHHGLWSKPYRLPLPDAAPEPFEYVGFAWNPEGHTPRGVWDVPHFDLHFYFEPPETVASIEGGSIEAVQDAILPEGYELAEGGAVVPKMGAHLAPTDAPERNGGEFTNTLIWGVADLADFEGYELHFVEPMITRAHLQGLSNLDRRPVAQPRSYQSAGWYPTRYSVRPRESGGCIVALEAFQERTP